MAEGWARKVGGSLLEVRSAGIEAHGKNPRAIAVMQEKGIDITRQESTKLSDELLLWADLVVTVCGNADENCPVLPPGTSRIHWPLDDPAKAQGKNEEIMLVFRASRDDIKRRVEELIATLQHV